MELNYVQLLATLMSAETCLRYQLATLTNLNDDYASLMEIFKILTIYASSRLIDISEILYIILIGIEANKRENSTVSSSIILVDEIFEFLVICMNIDNIDKYSKGTLQILFKHQNIYTFSNCHHI